MPRHTDFERIKKEFDNYYCRGQQPCHRGEHEYYAWLTALRLDETLPYGAARESFSWAKENIHFSHEDEQNKYYKVLVGFPVKSMNGNVYKERDLIAAAMSLKGAHPSLNHKDEFWFSPDNPLNTWGVLTITGAKYEDGAVEAILQVPKEAVCPICEGDKMSVLMDNKRIVNVSLEGECIGGYCATTGECDGFTFNQKGFSLLTSDILPGIPMARVFPIESYLPMLKGSSGKRKVKIVGIETMSTQTKKEGKLSGEKDPGAEPETTEPDAKGQCPEGWTMNAQLGKCVKREAAPPTQTHMPEGTQVAQGTPSASDTSQKPSSFAELKTEFASFDDCKAQMLDQGYDEETANNICGAICAGKSGELFDSKRALELAEALAARYNAESDLKSAKIKFDAELAAEKAKTADANKHLKIEQTVRISLEGRIQELRKSQENYDATMRKWAQERADLEERLRNRDRDLKAALDNVDKYKGLHEDLQKAHTEISGKYAETLRTNMALNKQISNLNEECLNVTKEKEDLEERLKKAKRLGKHISVKI